MPGQIVSGRNLSLLESFLFLKMYPKFQIKQKNKEGERWEPRPELSLKEAGGRAGAGSRRRPPASGSGGGRWRSPSDGGEAQSEELCSFFVCLFKSPEEISVKRTRAKRTRPVCRQRRG